MYSYIGRDIGPWREKAIIKLMTKFQPAGKSIKLSRNPQWYCQNDNCHFSLAKITWEPSNYKLSRSYKLCGFCKPSGFCLKGKPVQKILSLQCKPLINLNRSRKLWVKEQRKDEFAKPAGTNKRDENHVLQLSSYAGIRYEVGSARHLSPVMWRQIKGFRTPVSAGQNSKSKPLKKTELRPAVSTATRDIKDLGFF